MKNASKIVVRTIDVTSCGTWRSQAPYSLLKQASPASSKGKGSKSTGRSRKRPVVLSDSDDSDGSEVTWPFSEWMAYFLPFCALRTWALAHNPGSTAVPADGVMSAGVQFEPGSDEDEDEDGNDIEIDLVSSDEAEVQTKGCHMHRSLEACPHHRHWTSGQRTCAPQRAAASLVGRGDLQEPKKKPAARSPASKPAAKQKAPPAQPAKRGKKAAKNEIVITPHSPK